MADDEDEEDTKDNKGEDDVRKSDDDPGCVTSHEDYEWNGRDLLEDEGSWASCRGDDEASNNREMVEDALEDALH